LVGTGTFASNLIAKDGGSAGGSSTNISTHPQSDGSALSMLNTAKCFFASYLTPRMNSELTCAGQSLQKKKCLKHHSYSAPSNQTVNIMKSVYGMEIKDDNDPFYEIAEVSMSSLSIAGIFGTFYVDFIPFLKHLPQWFPGAGFLKLAKGWEKYVRALRGDCFMTLRKKMVRDDRSRKDAFIFMTCSLETKRGFAVHWQRYARKC